MDKISAMRSFVEVASCGSFTQAAEQLGLSRLQVSRHIKDLEQWLALRLLHRTTRQVSLTLQGEETLHYCQRILSEVAAMESRANSHNTELVGSIRIASPIGLGQQKLYDVVEAFCRLHPQVNIQLLLSDNLSQLVNDRVDIALRYTHQPDDSLIARRLMHIDNVICASPDYLAQHGAILAPHDLLQHNCLRHSSQQHWEVIANSQSHLLDVKGNLQANDMGVLINAALRGNGVVCLPTDLANNYLEQGELIDVLPHTSTPGKTLWAVYLSRSYQQNVVRAFIDFTANAWQDDIDKWQR
ncbi:LysR family transcriptional regulator [Shewanella metallivivens]|uniref:LysR family transcriptional regulator n=1 Tax=Shewanella metallivivens TaxID=2872342 RepID=A0ABT5TK80_9GAMM|nr:LysR family transcriptional regulator [Shewanella metallivivens]MDD8059018.1 LysR family transcriptional regulator [Shewanella metallivivens]